MATGVYHATMTDPDLHEPKGISTAPFETVYTANGSGSGLWTPAKLLGTPPNYGRLFKQANAITTTLTTQNAWYQSGITHDKLIYGVQNIEGTEQLVAPYQGLYQVNFTCTITHAAGATQKIAIGPIISGGTSPVQYILANCTPSESTNIAYSSIIELNQAATIVPAYSNKTSAAVVITVEHVIFTIELVRKV